MQDNQPIKTYSHLYEIQQLMKYAILNGKVYYLVKWANYQHQKNTWEPQQHICNLDSVLKSNQGTILQQNNQELIKYINKIKLNKKPKSKKKSKKDANLIKYKITDQSKTHNQDFSEKKYSSKIKKKSSYKIAAFNKYKPIKKMQNVSKRVPLRNRKSKYSRCDKNNEDMDINLEQKSNTKHQDKKMCQSNLYNQVQRWQNSIQAWQPNITQQYEKCILNHQPTSQQSSNNEDSLEEHIYDQINLQCSDQDNIEELFSAKLIEDIKPLSNKDPNLYQVEFYNKEVTWMNRINIQKYFGHFVAKFL